MRQLRLPYIFSILFVLFSSAAAWPWPPFNGVLVRRQDSSSSDGSSGSSSSSTQASESASASSESNSASVTDSASATPSESDSPSSSGTITSRPTATNSASASGSGSATDDGDDESTSVSSGSRTTNPSSSRIDPRRPAGGIQMITPSPLAGPQYYKIGDQITFGWNYTSLIVTPSAIDIMATCTVNQHLYTIATNQSVETSQAVTWDTGREATAAVPLVMAPTYTLMVYDAAKGISATPSPGHLGVYNQFVFGMYEPKAAVSASGIQCASCSAGVASVSLERQALTFMFSMVLITILSFTWFLGGVIS